ncbi:hypothetical protein IJG89_03680 [Candidatus Saccharibacteria bacterium]|nr:hypothetical protein [Candidatus Saccharibacteria bacterium]
MDVGSLDWVEARLAKIKNKLDHYTKMAELKQVSIAEAAGYENLNYLTEEVEDLTAFLCSLRPHCERWEEVHDLAETLNSDLTSAQLG